MVDFSALRKPAGKAMAPQLLPVGDYHGIIKSYEVGDQNKNNTPYVRFQIGYINWPDSATQEERGQTDEEGKFHPTDLSKRQGRTDFYLTEDALHRLDKFIKSCGVEANGRTYEEILPELRGKMVTVTVKQMINQQTSELFNTVDKITGQD